MLPFAWKSAALKENCKERKDSYSTRLAYFYDIVSYIELFTSFCDTLQNDEITEESE
jgi:hypothetical protein